MAHDGGVPFEAVGVAELFKHDLGSLAVGCAHGEEVEAWGVADCGRGWVCEDWSRHS